MINNFLGGGSIKQRLLFYFLRSPAIHVDSLIIVIEDNFLNCIIFINCIEHALLSTIYFSTAIIVNFIVKDFCALAKIQEIKSTAWFDCSKV